MMSIKQYPITSNTSKIKCSHIICLGIVPKCYPIFLIHKPTAVDYDVMGGMEDVHMWVDVVQYSNISQHNITLQALQLASIFEWQLWQWRSHCSKVGMGVGSIIPTGRVNIGSGPFPRNHACHMAMKGYAINIAIAHEQFLAMSTANFEVDHACDHSWIIVERAFKWGPCTSYCGPCALKLCMLTKSRLGAYNSRAINKSVLLGNRYWIRRGPNHQVLNWVGCVFWSLETTWPIPQPENL